MKGGTSRLIDLGVTLLCWCYFIFAFLLFYSPFYLAAACSARAEYHFQRLNRIFFKGFFGLLAGLSPKQSWAIDPGIAEIRSAVVVCNHLSYLDPILLVSLLGAAKTIVKPIFFSVPVFGWILRQSGFFPATTAGRHGKLMLTQMESMERYLQGGGNLFVFPEGTRSRDGSVGLLNQGAFKIARYCQAPIQVVCIRNTERLFTPGRFIFQTRRPNQIEVEIVDTIMPKAEPLSLTEVNDRIRTGLEGCMAATKSSAEAGGLA